MAYYRIKVVLWRAPLNKINRPLTLIFSLSLSLSLVYPPYLSSTAPIHCNIQAGSPNVRVLARLRRCCVRKYSANRERSEYQSAAKPQTTLLDYRSCRTTRETWQIQRPNLLRFRRHKA